MKVIGLLIETFVQPVLLDVIEYSNFDNIKTLPHDISESTCVSKAALLFFLGIVLFWLFVLTVDFLDELDFENGTITIIDVCETVAASFAQLFVNICIIIVVSWSNVEEALKVLCVNLVLLGNVNLWIEVVTCRSSFFIFFRLLLGRFFSGCGIYSNLLFIVNFFLFEFGYDLSEKSVDAFSEVSYTCLEAAVGVDYFN